ncbi:MAG: GNAT family N-acetyltransferase [Streptomyces sp.]|uniref:GNAT family N-acetyltransferase n=1 Tax=Streptomyces sp. TaxID=1931 RepID=UPI003D6C6D1F
MAHENPHDVVQITDPQDVTPDLRRELIECWVAVTNAGGAAGFPFPPVDGAHLAPFADKLIGQLDPERRRLLLALSGDALAGWVVLDRDPDRLISHWGTVKHLQTHTAFRGLGIGSRLMRALRVFARDEMRLEQLHLAARGGAGLEGFYSRLGWREIGRWPDALRLDGGDTRDEVLMVLTPL